MHSASNLLSVLEKVKSFSEFENILSNIAIDKEKGDLFELFCQAYLKVIYKKQPFKSIKIFKDVDASTLEKLNLRLSKDYGIDIVAITDTEDIWTIQVKFRQSDQLTWTELSTFKASSEKASFTLLMSNVSKVNHPHQTLSNFSSILRNEFEALTEEDFSIIKAHLKGQVLKPTIFTPRPHQVEAINAALTHFKNNSAGQMIHACGTGKTLTSLWIKEALKPKNTIVYVPSLSLLKQTLEEWTKHKSHNFSIKCVCSDQSVSQTAHELDETIVDITELGVPVTTNSKEITEFLKPSDKDKIIFSTYQSAPVILEALKFLPNFSFDFGVFDEAHRTASKSEHLFTKSLNTPVQKKLFMTATPKLYAPHLKTRAKEEDILLCSMDDTAIYGEVFHEIKFGEAIKLGLLSDYKIKVILITNDNIKELVDRRYWLNVLGKDITADELARVWALLKSLNETNHVISFHSRINGAREFQNLVEKTIELLKSHKKEVVDVKTYHITGEYPTYQRSKILSDFISQKKSLVTNARCLTEGVDVPAIDGVYFVDPKQNLIDIVQAVGRAMRKKTTKFGYIVIPVFIQDETNTEHIIESSAFRQVWSVVQAMKDQDARLSHVIEQLQELKGKKRFGSLSSRDQSEERALKADLGNIFDLSDNILPKNIEIPEFIEHISLKTLDIVGRSWDEHFGEYKLFKEKYGREPTQVSKIESEGSISKWVGHQRQNFKKNKLSQDRIDKLNSIGFEWDPFTSSWNKSFSEYKLFKEINMHEPIRTSKDESELFLVSWVSQQKVQYNKNKLSQDRIDKLNSIGFDWNVLESSWSKSITDYLFFKKTHNREPHETSKDKLEKSLAQWAGDQRKRKKVNKLSQDRIDKLNSIGFDWNVLESSWSKSFKDYKEFKEKNKREPNGDSKIESERLIASWISNQRTRFKTKSLSQDRINKLNSIGFNWNILNNSWEQNFKAYNKFKMNNSREPSGVSKNKIESSLASWTTIQRQNFKKNKLSQDRIDKLNSIGFEWDPLESSWEKSFQDYKEFKEKNNKEPSDHSRNKYEELISSWIINQRTRKRYLSKERIDKLNSIGFEWDPLESSWEKSFQDYKEFKERFGREPNNNSKDESEKFLAKWSGTQRIRYKKNKLSNYRINKLESVNFGWDPLESSWEKSFQDYKEFKEKNNRDPPHASKNKEENELYRWINDQRERYKQNKLSEIRVEKLNSIKFKWRLLENLWEQPFVSYQNFIKDHSREPSMSSKDESERFLARWANTQRSNFKRHIKITRERIDKLNSIGFKWSLRE